jgi:hypothetical protein
MADSQYLDEFIARQGDAVHFRLLEGFRTACRKAEVQESEYAANLRQEMDQILSEAIDEDPGPHDQ